MAQNHIQWQNLPILNPCLEAAEILGNVLVLPSQWPSGATGTYPTPYGQSLLQKHITDVEVVKERAPSITASGQRRAKTKIPDWRQPWGICLPVLCLDFRINLWFLLIVRSVWNGRSLLWSLLTKCCLSRSGNCVCCGIYSISYVSKWRDLRLAQG